MKYAPTVEGMLTALKQDGKLQEFLKTHCPNEQGLVDGLNQVSKDYLEGVIDVIDPRDLPKILAGMYAGATLYYDCVSREHFKDTLCILWELIIVNVG